MFRSVVPGLNWQWINTYRCDQECKVFFSKDNTVRRNFISYLVMMKSTNLEATWMFGQHLAMEKIWWWERAIPRGPPRGLCHHSDDVISDSCVRAEPGLNQQKPSADTHLLHTSILPLDPSKGFPKSSSLSNVQLFEVLILCVFMALKSLPYGHVVSNVGTKCQKVYRECLM